MDGGASYPTLKAAIIIDYEKWFQEESRRDGRVAVEGLPGRNWAAFERDGRLLVILLSFEAEPITATATVGRGTFTRDLEPYGTEVLLVE